jgi:hypothetical protein
MPTRAVKVTPTKSTNILVPTMYISLGFGWTFTAEAKRRSYLNTIIIAWRPVHRFNLTYLNLILPLNTQA